MQLPVGSYRLPFPQASSRRLVNCFAEAAPPERPNGQAVRLVRAPGILAFVDTEETECRGYTVMGDTLYVVAGDQLFSVTEAGVISAISGDSIGGNGPVRMANNGTDIVIVVPGTQAGYSSDGSTVAEITDSTFTGWGAIDVAYIEGYFVFVRPNSAQFFNPNVDSLTFNALKIITANGAPDNLVGIGANRGELMLPGVESFERWYDAGQTPGSPFARSPNGFDGTGCAAGMSLISNQDAVFMLAKDKTFRQFGGSWAPISNAGIDSVIAAMDQVSDCYGMSYSHSGHHFNVWTFPNGGRTVDHDMTTGEWHERESRINTVSLGRWRVAFIAQVWGKQIVGDRESGKLGILDPETFEEWGEPQVMSWAYPNVYAPGRGVSHRELTLFIAAGRGPLTGQGSDPKLTLYYSNDGGCTWTAKPFGSLGATGQHERRCRFFNLGLSMDRAYRVDVSDPLAVTALRTELVADGAYL